jgi:hypothetical protein
MATRWSISPVAVWSLRAILIGWVIAFVLVRLPLQIVEGPSATQHVVVWLSSYLTLMGLQFGWWALKRIRAARHAH